MTIEKTSGDRERERQAGERAQREEEHRQTMRFVEPCDHFAQRLLMVGRKTRRAFMGLPLFERKLAFYDVPTKYAAKASHLTYARMSCRKAELHDISYRIAARAAEEQDDEAARAFIRSLDRKLDHYLRSLWVNMVEAS